MKHTKYNEFLQFEDQTMEKVPNYRKKLIFGQTYIAFDDCHGKVKNDGHAFDISEFSQKMKEQLLKVPGPQSKSSSLKNLLRGGRLGIHFLPLSRRA